MADILKRIIENKRREIDALYKLCGDIDLNVDLRPTVSMSKALVGSKSGIIAEFKRRSPSKGEINPMASASDIVSAYEQAGASACSVLTDTPFFGGALSDLAAARQSAALPLLRKDFIISRRQIAEARLYGADAVLLIAAALRADEIADLTVYTHSLGMEVLFEIHNLRELDKFCPDVDMVGVNNRDLTTFVTDPKLSLTVASALPDCTVKVAESGLGDIAEVKRLRDVGYRGFLIGEAFMKTAAPGLALEQFIKSI